MYAELGFLPAVAHTVGAGGAAARGGGGAAAAARASSRLALVPVAL